MVARRPWADAKLTPGEKWKIRMANDPAFATKESIRNRIRGSLRRKGIKGDGLKLARAALKSNGTKGVAALERTLGYSYADLHRHLERQFTRGMTWERFRAGDIHIDHIRPLNTFDLNDPREADAAWALSNLRPLWAADNLRRPKLGNDVLL